MNLGSVEIDKFFNEWMNDKVINEPAKCEDEWMKK